jgi:hypothetical protein
MRIKEEAEKTAIDARPRGGLDRETSAHRVAIDARPRAGLDMTAAHRQKLVAWVAIDARPYAGLDYWLARSFIHRWQVRPRRSAAIDARSRAGLDVAVNSAVNSAAIVPDV